jgi:hypothetical protein
MLRWLAVSLLVLASADVRAQGLGDSAKRERQKRKTDATKPPRVYDNDDLQKGRPPGKKTEEGAKDATPPPDTRPLDEPDPGDVAAQEKRIRVEAAQANLDASEARVAKLETRIKQLEDSLNPMSPSFVYGASAGMSAAGGELRARDELQAAQKELLEARQAVEADRKALDEARSDRRSAG